MMSPFSRHPREPYAPPLGGPSDEEVAAAEAVLKAREKALKARDTNTLVFCAPGGYVTNGPVHCDEAAEAEEAGLEEQASWVSGRARTHRDDIARLTALLSPVQEEPK